MTPCERVDLRNLAERIQAIERRSSAGRTADHSFIDKSVKEVFPTGWPAIDAALGGGLSLGGLHEWFGVDTGTPIQPRQWTPPLCILSHLAWQALHHDSAGHWTIWVGRCCHPYPRVLVRDGGKDRRLLEHSLFVSPRDAATRLWAIELCLRSPAVGVVIGDGSGFDMAATRRIQMLTRSESKWALLARPVQQYKELSAAQTRWVIRGQGSEVSGEGAGGRTIADCQLPIADLKSKIGNRKSKIDNGPSWVLELLRCKGSRTDKDHRAWLVEWNRAESSVHLSAPLGDLASAAAKQPVAVCQSQSA